MPDTRPSALHKTLKLIARARSRGPGEVITLAKDRIREAWDSSDELIVLARATGGDVSPLNGLEFREANPADGHPYARDIGTDSPTTFAARLSERTRCFIVLEGTAILHATWVTTAAAWTREVHAYFVVPANEAYVYESFTSTEARGRGIYPYALQSISAWLQAHDVVRVWVAIEAHNQASRKAVEKAEFEEVFRVSFGRKWGRPSHDGPVWEGGPIRNLSLSSHI